MELKSNLSSSLSNTIKDRRAVTLSSKFRKLDYFSSLLKFRSGLVQYPGWMAGIFAYFSMQSYLPVKMRKVISDYYSQLLMTQKIATGDNGGKFYGCKFETWKKAKQEARDGTAKTEEHILKTITTYLVSKDEVIDKYTCVKNPLGGKADEFENVFASASITSTAGWRDTAWRLSYLSGICYYLEKVMHAIMESPQLWREASLPLLFKTLSQSIDLPGEFPTDKDSKMDPESQYADVAILYRLQVSADSNKGQASTDIFKSLCVPFDFFNFDDTSVKGLDLDSSTFKAAVGAKLKVFMTWLPKILAMNWGEYAISLPPLDGSSREDPIMRETLYAAMARSLFSPIIAPWIAEGLVRFHELSHPWLKDIYAQDENLTRKYNELKNYIDVLSSISMCNWGRVYDSLNQVSKSPYKGATIELIDVPRWIIELFTGEDTLKVVKGKLSTFSKNDVKIQDGLWHVGKLEYYTAHNDPTNAIIEDSSYVRSWNDITSALEGLIERTKAFLIGFMNSQEFKWFTTPQWTASYDACKKYIKTFESKFNVIWDKALVPVVTGVSKFNAEFSDISSVQYGADEVFVKTSVNMIMEKGRVPGSIYSTFNNRKAFNFKNISIRNLAYELEPYCRQVDKYKIPINYFKAYRAPMYAIDKLFPWGNSISRLHPAVSVAAGTNLHGYDRAELISALGYTEEDTFEITFESYLPDVPAYGKIAETELTSPRLRNILSLAAAFSNIGVIIVKKSANSHYTETEKEELKKLSLVIGNGNKEMESEITALQGELQKFKEALEKIDAKKKLATLTADELAQETKLTKDIETTTSKIKTLETKLPWLSDKYREANFNAMLTKWWIPGFINETIEIHGVKHTKDTFSHRPMGLNLSNPANMHKALLGTYPIEIIEGVLLLPYSNLQMPPSLIDGRGSEKPAISIEKRMTWGYEANLISPSDDKFYRELRTASVIGNDLVYEPTDKWISVRLFYDDTSHYEMRLVGIETTRDEICPILMFFREGQAKGGFSVKSLYQFAIDDGILYEPNMIEDIKKPSVITSTSIFPTKSSKGFESIVPIELEDGGIL